MSKLTNEIDRKNRLLSETTLLVTRGVNTDETRAEHAKLIAELDDVEKMITMLRKVEAFEQKNGPIASLPVPTPAVVVPASPEQRRAKVNAAAREFFRHGNSKLSEESRSLLTTSDTTGEALVSQSFDDVFIEASKYFGPIFNMVHRKDAETGNPTKFVVSDSTNQNFTLVAEGGGSVITNAQQPTLFSDIVGTDALSSSFVYSVQEGDDSFDLSAFLIRQAGVAVSRMREKAITLGTDGSGTVLPNGAGGLLASVTAGVTQAPGSLVAGPSYAQLSALAGSVDRSNYQTGSFMASPSVETFLRSQVSSIGTPFYPIDSDGYLIVAGKRLLPNASMPAIGTASSPLVIFGDVSKAWNVLNTGIRIKVIGNNDGSPALSFLTRVMVIWTRLGQSAGLSNSVKSLVSAAS